MRDQNVQVERDGTTPSIILPLILERKLAASARGDLRCAMQHQPPASLLRELERGARVLEVANVPEVQGLVCVKGSAGAWVEVAVVVAGDSDLVLVGEQGQPVELGLDL